MNTATMDINTVIVLIAAVTLLVALIGTAFTIIKFLLGLKDEVVNLRIEMTNRITILEHKFDMLDERYKNTNTRIDRLEIETNEKIKENAAEANFAKEEVKELRKDTFNIIDKLANTLQLSKPVL